LRAEQVISKPDARREIVLVLLDCRATGSMRLAGMILPGNGSRMNSAGLAGFTRVVAGSWIVIAPPWSLRNCEKSPRRKASVGTV
jgi:hypothetical protein